MASSHKINAPAQANQADTGATNAANTAENLSSQSNTNAQGIYNTLYGPNGSMTQMANPANLNVTQPTGAFATTNTEENEQTQQGGQAALSSAKQDLANSGMGPGTASGAAGDAELQARLAESNQMGQNFATNTQNSYNAALNNFWNASNSMSGAGAQQAGEAASTNANAGQIQNSIYGTAGTGYQQPSTAGTILGDVMNPIGNVASAGVSNKGK